MLVKLKSELGCPLLETVCIAGKVCGIAGEGGAPGEERISCDLC